MRTELTIEEKKIYFKYADLALPRHTSYPIAPMWKDSYSQDIHKKELKEIKDENKPISLYFHIPLCHQLCYYCACNKEIRPKQLAASIEIAKKFIESLKNEVDLYEPLLKDLNVEQIHFGGGTPTYFEEKEFEDLFLYIKSKFTISKDSEISIEIDPRTIDKSYLNTLFNIGFNRVSLGVQEFDPKIQKAINRIQPLDMVERVVKDCREAGFLSINFDLIYGLPYQTKESIQNTLDEVTRIKPDRIAFYRLAVIPDIFKWQKAFVKKDLPEKELALDLNLTAISHFQKNSYQFIGLDHFARDDEELAIAYRNKTLRRTFQGMTTGGSLDIIGFGPSAISILDGSFSQNEKSRSKWQEKLDGNLPVVKGLKLTQDDKIRRAVLQDIYGYGEINIKQFELEFDLNFKDYFSSELQRLDDLKKQGIVEVSDEIIKVTKPLGVLLVRVVGAVFDAYLPKDAYKTGLLQGGASKI